MTSNWTLNEKSTGVLEVTVEGDAWKKAQNKALKKIKSRINIKGFRPGQVPEALIKKQISKEALYAEAAEEIANEALVHGIDENKLELVARPTLDIKEANDDKVVMAFNCVVSPEVTLGDYKGLDIHKEEVEVTEEDINAEVERIQNRYADWVIREEDEEAQLKDQVTIDFVGEKDGVAFEGGSGENYPLELGSGTFIPGFEEQLIGAEPEKEVEVKVTFPEDYHAEDLKGKEAVFKCTVHEIKAKELPELDDEFASEVSEFDTLDELKTDIKAKIKEQKVNDGKRAQEDAAVDAIIESAKMDLPEAMVDTQARQMLDEFAQRMQQQGLTLDQYMQFTGMTADKMMDELRPQAEKRIKTRLVLEAIAKPENIEITDEKLDEEIAKMAEAYQMEADKLKSFMGDKEKEQMKQDMAVQEAITFVVDNAVEK